ncbi:PH domain-containing protein [Jeotgalibacillus terrae]|uniref:PH domain-containing protein n=1 Tax=Jeotgalibacillus terrae TaxID=587735 RepID=A0ABW5ZJN0_9BACL|nr:PH domain-containing protein [Jeotgalibacillus terrae]MBM7578646.1 hypothetical protein [Jeotgalibacillus terrae]
MYFKSKRDPWMTVLLWAFAIAFISFPIFFPKFGVWMTPGFLDQQWIKIAALSPIGFLCLWIWFETGYTVNENVLKINYGPFKKLINIQQIKSIRETKNPFTDPALSMDKIEINYSGFKTIAISPENKNVFIRELMRHHPEIQIKS